MSAPRPASAGRPPRGSSKVAKPHLLENSDPSPWVVRWAGLIAPGGSVLDVACGSGRHLRWLAARGHRVTGVDRDAAAAEPLRDIGERAEIVIGDIENGAWPFAGRGFDAVIVTNYLWRPRLADIVAAVAPGGVLIYETFGLGQARFGRPSRADFLLAPGELLQATAGLVAVAYEHGLLDAPPRVVQRIVARRAPEAPEASAQVEPAPLWVSVPVPVPAAR